MNLNKYCVLLKKDYAVLGQPIGLLVALIIATIIITLFSVSIHHLTSEMQVHDIERQIDTILLEATTMFEYADEGSLATIQVTFPISMRFIVFGDHPRNGTTEPYHRTLDENTTNNYYYVMDDGSVRTFHSNARFSNCNMTQIAVFYPGTYTIILELCQKEGKTYVTMSEG